MKQALRYLFTVGGCIALVWMGVVRASAAGFFLAAILAVMLISSIRFYWIGQRLRSIRAEHQPLSAKQGNGEDMIFHVTLKLDRPFPVLWLRVTEFWTRTGGEGGTWMCRRLLFPRRRRTLAFTSSFVGAPRGVYELERIEFQHGDLFGWFKHHVIIRPVADTAPICIMPPAMTQSNMFVSEQAWQSSQGSAGQEADDCGEGLYDQASNSMILPESGHIAGSIPNTQIASGYRSAELRAFRAGDPLRSIDWRVYAKRRTLSVRVPESGQREQWDIAIDDSLWRLEWNLNTNDKNKNGENSKNAMDDRGEKENERRKLVQKMEETLAVAASLIQRETEAGRTVRLIWISDGRIVQGARNAMIALAAEQLGTRKELWWVYDETLPSSLHSDTSVHRRLAVVSAQRFSQMRGAVTSFAGLGQVDQWLHVDDWQMETVGIGAPRSVRSTEKRTEVTSAEAMNKEARMSDGQMNDSGNRGEYHVYSDNWTSAQG
ncbi:DUF58 domain-containing protein [Paenibacillus alvei]|uniref:DUF58 domain-containing protein n=1 Tax=Paenibacillus alvei TaxID=44250 RepID=A0AAP7DJR3_PAEAL|nr:DUF58 domain-containing protein [Paenibacillus alvei]NOJ72952.1 DUF58 domain-containing protein [Paenibacillus alvei]